MDSKNDVQALKKYIAELEEKLAAKEGLQSEKNNLIIAEDVRLNFFNNIPLGIIGIQVDDYCDIAKNKIIQVNKFFTDITGLSAHELHNKNITELISNNFIPPDFCKEIFYEKKRIDFKSTLINSNKYFHVTAFSLDETLLILALNDFTRLKEAEDTIVFERNLFQTLLNKFPDCIYFKDKKARFLRASLYQTQLFHTTPNEIIGKTDFNFYSKELAEIKFQDDMQVINSGIPIINKEERGSIFDEKVRWLSTTKLPLFNRKGEIEGLFGISRDITDEKLAEEKQNEYNENLIALNESALQLLKQESKKQIFENLSFTLENQFSNSITVYTFNQTNGSNWFETRNKNEHALKITNLLNKHKAYDQLTSDKSFHEKLAMGKLISCNREGRKCFNIEEMQGIFNELDVIHKYILPIAENKKITGLLILFFTKGQKLEEKNFVDTFIQQASLIIHRKNLEEQLIIEKDRAEESDNLKSSFLANLSHEIRTPINAIQGFGELLKIEDLAFDKKMEYIGIIQEKSNQLIQIITDIIDISKFEANQVKVNETRENLNEFLKSIIKDFEFRMNNYIKKDIPILLAIGLPDHACFINTDFALIKQVIANLLSNAIKFTQNGIIELGYTLEGNMLQFFVRDTGIGIPQDKRELIFERFRQVDESRTRKFGGTGLGLTISKSIIGLIQGKIWVDDALPEEFSNQDILSERLTEIGEKTEFGAKFSFTIPYKPVISDVSPSNMEKEIDWSTKHILVVEDDSFNFQYIEEVLGTHHPKISHCKNGKDAVTFFTENKKDIHLILMDLQMPVMDGFDATKLIRNEDDKVPIIVQTAYSMPEDIKKSKEAGSTDFIVKPYNSNSLIDKITKYL